MDWNKAVFLLSAYDDTAKIPHFPEIAVLGRSNVGKSTLLNSIFNSKGLVKTSSRPGKTEAINYFAVDNKLLFADLPGFGYAKVALEKKQKWAKLVDNYVRFHKNIKLFLLLIDVRREIQEEELLLVEIAQLRNIPLLVVLTKCDKLTHNEFRTRLAQFKKLETVHDLHIMPHAAGEVGLTDPIRKKILETVTTRNK